MSNRLIDLQHITKIFDGEKILDDLNLYIRENEFLTLLGPSGCGKTTTLRIIGGFLFPDEGSVIFDGKNITQLAPNKRQLNTVFQKYALFPNMTVEQNILCGLKAERNKAARKARCAEMLQAMRLESLAKRYPAQLSGGQQQRTALARILVGRPKILMLDEPFSALDSYLREEVEGEVGSLLAGFAGTALLVTHNRDEAYRLCREMIVMDSGEVLRAGTTKEVFADPRTRAAARLTGCKNILPCTRVGEHTVHLAGWEQPLTVALPVPEGCRAVGIRAHDFAPCAPGTPNSLPVQAVSTSENPFDWNMIFTLPGGEARLWWKVSKETLAAPPPKAPACLAAAPENIMPLV
jgi:molybdate transport system ATP-binding protein